MALTSDLPGFRFVLAKGYTIGRPDGPPLWIVWHSMETDELPNSAEGTANYTADPGDSRDVSAHWCFDSNSAVQTVKEKDSAWTVGNRQGNYRGVNLELAGRARQTRAEWLDAYGRAMFDVAAPVVAASMKRWKIPNRWCTVADLKAYRGGHTTHVDLARTFGGSDHTDPGAGFPRDYVLDLIGRHLAGPTPTPPAAEESEMPQILVRLVDLPEPDRDQVWRAGGGFMHRVTLASVVGDGQDPAQVLAGKVAGTGPISNSQVHGGALLGPLANDGRVFQSKRNGRGIDEYRRFWGVEYPPAVLTDDQLADVAAAAADGASDGASRGTITLTGTLAPASAGETDTSA